MQIIFGDHVEKVRDRFTVLELDTIRFEGSTNTMKVWCALENIPLQDIPLIETLSKIHHDLMDQYRQRNWNFCQRALEQLRGRWGGEVDSFYDDLAKRVEGYLQEAPPPDWNGEVVKSIVGQD